MWIATPKRPPASPLPPIVTSPSIKSVRRSGKGNGFHRRRFGGGAISTNGALRMRPLLIRRKGGCIAEGRIRLSHDRRFSARRRERRARDLLGIEAMRGSLWRVLTRGERLRHSFRSVLVAEACQIAKAFFLHAHSRG